MGWGFRKSKKIGPLRINFSKSGIGYSVGTKGFRVTKKAGGGYRTTSSIPGTGISYVKNYPQGKTKKTKNKGSIKSQKTYYEKRRSRQRLKFIVGIIFVIGGFGILLENTPAGVLGLILGAAFLLWGGFSTPPQDK